MTILLGGVLLAAATAPADDTALTVGAFSAQPPGGALPGGWRPLHFRNIDRHTRYALVRDGGQVVVQATAEASASGLVRELTIDPREHPRLAWRWKIGNVLEKGDVSRKDGDDYPARVYVTFAYDPTRVGAWERAKYEAAKFFYGHYPPLRSINYIWESRAPVGTVVPNAYTERVRMIVLRSGAGEANRWVGEERDLVADYHAAFGEEPPTISGIAIMTDTDNTGERATAWYGDIRFLPRAP
jgi:hypothetical protein